MPRLVFDSFIQKLEHDIVTNYDRGQRYLSVRDIAKKFGVSVQTAQKGVTFLSEKEILIPRKRAGIFVGSVQNKIDILTNKTIIVMSRIATPIFYQGFLDGVKERAAGTGITIKLKVIQESEDISSLAFGERLINLQASGIITLGFTHESALPFYHALLAGIDIVADIILDDLPLLPSVQTDNYKHAFAAGRIMNQMGLENLYVFGTYPKKNKRLLGFSQAIQNPDATVSYQQLSGVDVLTRTMSILGDMNSKTGIFLSDYTTLHNISALCSRFNISFMPNTVLAYDAANDKEVLYPGVPPIPYLGPTFKELGYNLCDTLIHKWTKGYYPEPIQRKI